MKRLIIKIVSMKKFLLCGALVFVVGLTFTSCRDNKKADSAEEALQNTGKAIDNAAKTTDGALEQTGKAIDNAVDATDDAIKATGEAIKSAGQAVDKKVDEVRKD